MKHIPKFCCSNPKFDHFHEVHHLLLEVHLVPLLPVHLDLQGDGPWWNKLIYGHEIPKWTGFCCLVGQLLKFYHFQEVHHLLVEVHLVPLLPVHLSPGDNKDVCHIFP